MTDGHPVALGWWVEQVRSKKPLVHNITNLVVMQVTANVLLAGGASPVMAHATEEVEDMVRLAGALVLNIGTLDPSWVSAMRLAGAAAHAGGVPVVLDPVGAGATPYRTAVARDLLESVKPAVVRGNAGEVGVLARGFGQVRGVDAGGATVTPDEARALARRTGAIVVATGPVDLVTDGTRLVRIANGHPWLEQVTGTGCSLSALVGAFIAAAGSDAANDARLHATVAALVYFEVAAEHAARQAAGPGSFQVALLDALATLPSTAVDAEARVTWDG
jgi:hydroxyethylthiazole kinase